MPFLSVSTASSGDNTLVAAGNPNQKIRVCGYTLVVASAVTVQWKTGTAGSGSNVALSGVMSLITGTPLVCPAAPLNVAARNAYLETAPGEALNLNLGGNVQVSGHLEYEYRTV